GPHLRRGEADTIRTSESSPPPTGAAAKETPAASILVVDDQSDVADLLRIDLETEGHRVAVATRMEEALEQFARRRFDLAIIDVMLGGDSGYELTAGLIASPPDHLPVVLVTAGGVGTRRGAENRAESVHSQ